MKDRKTILVVEDDSDIRELMKIFIEADGYRVDLAADGIDALEQLRRGKRPALILLDLMLPRLDGEQFLNIIRKGRFADIPVVVLSGHSEARGKANELKVASCLNKPVEAEDLLNAIRKFADRRSTKDAA